MNWGASGRNGGMATTGLAIGFRNAIKRYGEQRAVGYFQEYDKAIDLIENLVEEQRPRRRLPALGQDQPRLEAVALRGDAERRRGPQAARRAARGARRSGQPPLRDRLRRLPRRAGRPARRGHARRQVRPRPRGPRHRRRRIDPRARRGRRRRADRRHHDPRPEDHARHRGRRQRGARHERLGQKLPRWRRRRVIPISCFIVVTEPLPQELVDELLPTRSIASDSENFIYYLRSRRTTACSSAAARASPSRTRRRTAWRRDPDEGDAPRLFPQTRDARIDYMWGGLVDISMDQMVHASNTKGIHYALNYSGHGVRMADAWAGPWPGDLGQARGQHLARSQEPVDTRVLRPAVAPPAGGRGLLRPAGQAQLTG